MKQPAMMLSALILLALSLIVPLYSFPTMEEASPANAAVFAPVAERVAWLTALLY
jgi:hypothetical protein